jgi:excisionase family DNA binding protein
MPSQSELAESAPVIWLTPAQAAPRLRVETRTLQRWANARRLTVVRTLGGHRRYKETEVDALAARLLVEAEPAVAA